MEIKVKESLENRLNNPQKQVFLKLVGDTTDYSRLVWGFDIVSGATGVTHSSDSGVNVFLNYDTTEPVMELNLPSAGTYVVKFIVNISFPEDGNITSLEYHANGHVETIESVGTVMKSYFYTSNELTLNYVVDGDWI